jgi:hypothetical protein
MNLSRIRLHLSLGKASVDVSAKEAGQIIVLFALMLTVIVGMIGLAIDVTYAWRNGLQVQRAADAGALAGVVYLPGDVGTASLRAKAIAGADGYTADTTTSITVAQNPANDHQLDVTITDQVPTFFVRLFGVNNWTITRKARAAFVMPVPMGSPLAYYGVGCLVLKTGTAPACNNPATTNGASGVSYGGSNFNSLGAWGAVITYGGNANNGDAYDPFYNVGYTNPNPIYDPKGYNYTVGLPAGGDIRLYDPGFCAMGSYGTGDHWIDHDNNGSAYSPVSTYYRLWDTHNQPLNPTAWTFVTDSGTTFQDQHGQDTTTGSGTNGSGACDAYHNNWNYALDTGLAAGTYEVEVTTTSPSEVGAVVHNLHTNAENMFSILAVGGGSPTVYGQSRMAVYNNLAGGLQQFYMAKVDAATGAGKTLQIDLFDIGDSTAGSISILSPAGAGGTQTTATFNYTTSSECIAGKSDACSGNGRTSITVAGGSGSSFNSTWLHISIPLGNTYGSGGLWQGGWWQVKYNVTAGNDTTTWSVNVAGNPVHLVPTGG